MLKLFCLVFLLGILISGLDLGLVKSTVVTRNDNSLARVKRIAPGLGDIAYTNHDTVFRFIFNRTNKIWNMDCTGTFIAPNLILTITECIDVDVRMNRLLDPARKTIKMYNAVGTVEATISKVHSAKDIAVLELSANVDSVKVAPMDYRYNAKCGEEVYLHLYDMTHMIRKQSLLVVYTVKVVKCWYSDTMKIESHEDFMYIGDRGGPLFNQNDQLIGLLLSCREVTICYFARISRHRKFLQQILDQNQNQK